MGELSRLSWRAIDTIQKLIEAKGMTDAEVIVKSGIPRNTFYRKMRGDTPLNTDDLDAIARALEVDPFELLREVPENVTPLHPRAVGGSVEDLPAAARTTDPDDGEDK